MFQKISTLLRRVCRFVAEGKVRFTYKVLEEMSLLEVGMDQEDVCHVLQCLEHKDFCRRIRSRKTGEWLYVFKPDVSGLAMYLKLAVRLNCVVVVSFHEDIFE